MYAHAQARRGPRHLHAGSKRATIRQQRCTGDNAVAVGLGDSAIYAFRPAQVIRIDDQTLHKFAGRTGQPVLSTRYTMVRDHARVPLTVSELNFSMGT